MASMGVFWAVLAGLIAGLAVGKDYGILYWNWN